MNTYKDFLRFIPIQLHHYDVIFGTPWLTHYNPTIDWSEGTLFLSHLGQLHGICAQEFMLQSSVDHPLVLVCYCNSRRLVRKQDLQVFIAVLKPSSYDITLAQTLAILLTLPESSSMC